MRRCAFAVGLLVIAGCTVNQPWRSVAKDEACYRKGDTSVLDVFNVRTRWIANMGVEYLRLRDASYGEWGGSFVWCSDAEFHCIDGGIAAVIPKTFNGQTTWELAGIACRSERPLVEGEIVSFDCRTGGFANQITYSQSLGILSYENALQPAETYRLVGGPGLFGQTLESRRATY